MRPSQLLVIGLAATAVANSHRRRQDSDFALGYGFCTDNPYDGQGTVCFEPQAQANEAACVATGQLCQWNEAPAGECDEIAGCLEAYCNSIETSQLARALPCSAILDQGTCNTDGRCGWDAGACWASRPGPDPAEHEDGATDPLGCDQTLGLLYCPAISTDNCYRPESDRNEPATVFHWAATCIEGGGGGPDASDPNGCGAIFVMEDCDDTALCSWDWDATTCRPFTCSQAADGEQCAAVSDPAAPDGCSWLDESGICMAPGEEVSCRRFATCRQCPPGRCNFNDANQRCEAWTECSNIDEFTEAACTAIPHCAWSNSNGCFDSSGGGGGGGGCTAVASQDHEQTCKDSDSCIWTPTIFAVGPVTTASPVAPRICYDPPSAAPTTASPTAAPSTLPSAAPATSAPTPAPTAVPTPAPTAIPTTRDPTPSPTVAPTVSPSGSPVPAPTGSPLTAWVPPTAQPTTDAAGDLDGDSDNSTDAAGDLDGDGDGLGGVGAGDADSADPDDTDGMGTSSQDNSKKKNDDDGSNDGIVLIAAIVVGGLVLVGIGVITLLLRKRAKQRTQRAAHHAAHRAHTVAKNQAFEKEKAGQNETGPSKGQANAQPKNAQAKARPGQSKPKPAAAAAAAGTVQEQGGRKVLMLGRNEDDDC